MTDWREEMRTCAFMDLNKKAKAVALLEWCSHLAIDGGLGEYKHLDEHAVRKMLTEHDFVFYENGIPVWVEEK